ncbi:MAG TPA: isocitrate/isopropylmalate dehydrogenase family protein, partial [Clostridiales bacterium]|nr:isocitrate/isopropylmalate dehydrogenase family protein [Clostridiales bacterium]
MNDSIDAAVEKFAQLARQQAQRAENLKQEQDFTDFSSKEKIVIGICGGDGIGPVITAAAQRILMRLLAGESASGAVEFRVIEGLTIENRAAAHAAIPPDVLDEIKRCEVIL